MTEYKADDELEFYKQQREDRINEYLQWHTSFQMAARIRMIGARCDKCLMYSESGKEFGLCRSRPPKVHEDHADGVFPGTPAHSWCGCFVARYGEGCLPKEDQAREVKP